MRFTSWNPYTPPMPIRIRRLSKRFACPGGRRCALDGIDLDIADGEMVALIGPSGSGKSTLIRHIAGLVAGDLGEGEITVGTTVMQKDGRIGTGARGARAGIGVVFQQFNLVPRLDTLTNVLVGALPRHPIWRTLLGLFPRHEREAAMRCLDRVGLADRASQRASTLSGGQQQRVAIARTLLQGASTLLADEPIASLDPPAARRVMDVLARINEEDRATVVVSLHQVAYARSHCPRAIALRAGRVVYDGPSADLDDARLASIYDHAIDGEDDSGSAQRPAVDPGVAGFLHLTQPLPTPV